MECQKDMEKVDKGIGGTGQPIDQEGFGILDQTGPAWTRQQGQWERQLWRCKTLGITTKTIF